MAGLALITRRRPEGATECLAHWSRRWDMFSLVGGHVDPGESFRECCAREVAEELGLAPDLDYRVAPEPLRPRQEYTAFSRSAGVETRYVVELFAVELLTPEARQRVDADPRQRWLGEDEIRRRRTGDGQPVSAQVETVLRLFGVL
jgi:8-oxo-dGTP pyrophosphatase MutT (NUDIX family)